MREENNENLLVSEHRRQEEFTLKFVESLMEPVGF